jgi:hypothetical protein
MDYKVNGLTLSDAILTEMKTVEGIGNLLNLGGSESEHPQVKALKQFISTAKETWDKNLYQWRLKRVQDQIDMAGEPGAGMGPPVDAKGNPIPVLPNNEWLKKNPGIVKEIPGDCLPPGMQQPNMVDKIKQTFGIQETVQDPNFAKYAELMSKYDMLSGEMAPDASGVAKNASPEFVQQVTALKTQADQLAGANAPAWEQARKAGSAPQQTNAELGTQLEDSQDAKEKYKSLLDKRSKAFNSTDKEEIDKDISRVAKQLANSQDWNAQELLKNNPPPEKAKAAPSGSNQGLSGVWSVPDPVELNENAELDRIKSIAKKLLG